MQTYCVSCKSNTENKNVKIVRTKNGRLQMRSFCFVCGNKKSKICKRTRGKGNFIISKNHTRVKNFVLIHSSYKNEQS